MQAVLLTVPTVDVEDRLWLRAALRECIQYGDHGVDTEVDEHGREVCFNCGGAV